MTTPTKAMTDETRRLLSKERIEAIRDSYKCVKANPRNPEIEEELRSDIDALCDMALRSEGREGWIPVCALPMPRDRTSFLVANAKGDVAPHIRGVIHNDVGTANDWAYGESITHWMPLPAAPDAAPPAPNRDAEDARRYRWIRSAAHDAAVSKAFVNICESEPATAELFDQAINAALAAAPEREGEA